MWIVVLYHTGSHNMIVMNTEMSIGYTAVLASPSPARNTIGLIFCSAIMTLLFVAGHTSEVDSEEGAHCN